MRIRSESGSRHRAETPVKWTSPRISCMTVATGMLPSRLKITSFCQVSLNACKVFQAWSVIRKVIRSARVFDEAYFHGRRNKGANVFFCQVVNFRVLLIGHQAAGDLREGVGGDDGFGTFADVTGIESIDIQSRSDALPFEDRVTLLSAGRGNQ